MKILTVSMCVYVQQMHHLICMCFQSRCALMWLYLYVLFCVPHTLLLSGMPGVMIRSSKSRAFGFIRTVFALLFTCIVFSRPVGRALEERFWGSSTKWIHHVTIKQAKKPKYLLLYWAIRVVPIFCCTPLQYVYREILMTEPAVRVPKVIH